MNLGWLESWAGYWLGSAWLVAEPSFLPRQDDPPVSRGFFRAWQLNSKAKDSRRQKAEDGHSAQIPATLDAEIRRTTVQGQYKQNVRETPSQPISQVGMVAHS
jgi:hypothetical protein